MKKFGVLHMVVGKLWIDFGLTDKVHRIPTTRTFVDWILRVPLELLIIGRIYLTGSCLEL